MWCYHIYISIYLSIYLYILYFLSMSFNFSLTALSVYLCFIDYQLVIICSSEGEGKSHIISHLHSYQREWNLPSEEDKMHLKQFLRQHVTQQVSSKFTFQDTTIVNASVVDQDK